jgi:hypothetical protein
MMSFFQMSVCNVLRDINQEDKIGGIFLPYIQRDFVWKEDRIYRLLDSMMRRYPIGTILAWETEEPINYRPFVQDYTSDYNMDAEMKTSNKENPITRRYVLDGQQRLQSLYIAMFGSYEGNDLYFDLSCDPQGDEGYQFKFMPSDEVHGDWIKVKDLISKHQQTASIPYSLEEKGIIKEKYTSAVKKRMGINATRCYEIFYSFLNLPMEVLSIADEIGINDIADVFVRTNSEGMILEKSDLIMASIKGTWSEAGAELDRVQNALKTIGFKNTKDFTMRSFLGMLGHGTKYDADKLTKPEVQMEIKEHFNELSIAIFDILKFIADFSFIGSAKVPSWNPLILLACYRYHHKDSWEKEKNDSVSKFLFMAFLSKAFSSANPTMMDALVKDIQMNGFALSRIEEICHKNKKDPTVNIEDILDTCIGDKTMDLVLHLLYMGKHGYDHRAALQQDHIFPQSVLENIRVGKKQKYPKDVRNQLANCEWLSPKENLDKSDMLPKAWFQRFDVSYWHYHTIPQDSNLLELDNFEAFIKNRRALISVALSQKLAGLVSVSVVSKKKPSKPKTAKS